VKPLPLRTTLTLLYAVVLSVILTAVGWAYHAALKRQLDNSVTADLEDKARALHGYLRFNNRSVDLAYDTSDAEEAAFIGDATRYYQVYDGASGALLLQSPGLESLGLKYTPKEVSEFRGSPGIHDVQTDRGRLRLTSTVITAPGGGVYLVQVGTLLDRLDASLIEFDRVLAVRTLFGVIIAALMGFAFSGFALAPLRRFTAHATAIDITNLQARLPVRGAGDELDQLAEAFNQSLTRLERSVNEMRQFSAAVAHELRTPLAILRGEAEMALTAPLSAAAARERLASQIDEYDRLSRLINQILMLARAEAGELTVDAASINLSTLASHVAEQVDALAEAKGITLATNIAPNVLVNGDAGWIERLLLILIDNAIKFTPQGGRVTITVANVENRPSRPEFNILAVADTGVGIAPEALPRVFEPFYRGDAAQSRRSEGAGIGLALAKWIAEAHHGELNVTSAPNAGSTFTLRFAAAD
jgi:heavy metal sensor kinase